MAELLAAFCLLARPCSAGSELEKALTKVRAGRSDLSIRTDRWETRMTLPAVEDLLKDPLKTPEAMERWSNTMRDLRSSSETVVFAASLLGVQASTEPASSSAAAAAPELLEAPMEVRQALGGIVAAMAAAGPELGRAVGSLSAEERRRVLEAVRPLLTNDSGRRLDPRDFDVMSRFDLAPLASAAVRVARSVDAALPILREQARFMANFSRARVKTAAGDLLVSGGADDVYNASDLKDAALLIDFGGTSRYADAPAAAGEGELKVVIDLGREVEVEAEALTQGPGSGVFGIGLLYLPEPGKKSLQAGSFSLGAGLFGVGGLWLKGDGARLSGKRFSQGAAAFGLGLYEAEGKEARYDLEVAGQGFGFTRGAGLFRHQGDGAVISGGQSVPDPHEPLAALSLSQGAGNGPRAFAAGGFGLALVAGDRCDVRASYMAQGMGYWHAFGGFFLLGDENRVQARRYALGAGVHAAAGGFRLFGNRNRVLTWGAGPGMGWDYGVGFLDARGDENTFSSQWASGRGDVNGHGFAAVQGDRNKIALADLGSGALKRGAPSYGVAALRGEDNRLLCPYAEKGPLALAGDPWGILEADQGFRLDPALKREAGDWVPVAREEALARDRRRLERELEAASGKPPMERFADWLNAAAKSGLDGETSFRAARLLITASDEELPILVRLVLPDAFDELVWLRTLIPAFGRTLIPILENEFGQAQGMRRVLLLSFLRQLPVSAAGPLFEAAGSADWRLRREAAASLGRLFNREQGQEPGRLRLLGSALRLCLAKEPLAPDSPGERSWIASLGEQNLVDLFGVLSLGPGLSPSERALLLVKNNPFEPARKEAFREFARLLRARGPDCASAIKNELEKTAAQEPGARKVLLSLLRDPDKEVVQAAVAALGGIGDKEDAPKLAAFLDDPSALIRDTAATSLGRMGAAAKDALALALKSPSPKIRVLAAIAIARTSEAKVLALLLKALDDNDEEVRRSALAALLAVQAPQRAERRRFVSQVKDLAKEPSPSMRAAALRALADIGD